MAEVDEAGWVIERDDSSPAEPKYWAAGQTDASRSSAWTSNHMQAIRFARKLDARRVAERIIKGIEVRIAEHSWSVAPQTYTTNNTSGPSLPRPDRSTTETKG